MSFTNGNTEFNPAQFDNHFGLRGEEHKGVILSGEDTLFKIAALKEQPKGGFDVAHLKAFNEHYFGAMYEWAGKLREGEGKVCGGMHTSTTPPTLLDMELKRVLKSMVELNRPGVGKTEFSDRIAGIYCRLVALAPFPHGNERTARQFIDAFAQVNGFEMNWDGATDNAGSKFRDATMQAIKGNGEPMRGLMREATEILSLSRLHSVSDVNAAQMRLAAIAGIDDSKMPSALVMGSSQEHLNRFAHFAEQMFVKQLEQFSAGALGDADQQRIEATAFAAEAKASGRSALESIITATETVQQVQRLKSPGM